MTPDVELVAFLMCDSFSRQPNGKAIITGVFDRIWASQVPAVHPSMTAYFRLRATASAHLELRLAFVTPNGLRQESPPLPMQVRPDGVVEGTIELSRFLMEGFGNYDFEIIVQGKRLASYAITVAQLSPAKEKGEERVH